MSENVTENEVLTVPQAAILLQVSEWVVRKMARDKVVPARKVGKEYRFSRQALMDWLSKQ